MKKFPAKILGVLFLGVAGLVPFGAGAEDASAPAARVDAAHAAVAAPAKKVAPEYVPIVVDRAQWDAVRAHLGKQPFDVALPLMRWLEDLEARAKTQWEADNAAKEGAK